MQSYEELRRKGVYDAIRRTFKRLCRTLSGTYKERIEGSRLIITCTEIPEEKWIHIDTTFRGFGYGITIQSKGKEVGYLDEDTLYGVEWVLIRSKRSMNNEIDINQMGREYYRGFSGMSIKNPSEFRVTYDEFKKNLIIEFY